MKSRDSLDRALPNQPDSLTDPYTVTNADIYSGMEPLNIHGSLYTSYLEAFGEFYRDMGDYSRKRLSWLSRSANIRYLGEVSGPVYYRPLDQFPVEHERITRRMMLRYDLTPRGIRILKDTGRYHDLVHGGWLKHQVVNTHISASIHLGALHDEEPFTPRDQIARDIGLVVPYTGPDGRPYEKHRLVPDNLFRVGRWRRYHTLETDLGNEVGRASPEKFETRKTLERMVLQYNEFVTKRLYCEAYNIPVDRPLTPLFVTTNKATLELLTSILMDFSDGKGCGWMCMKYIPAEAFSAYHSPKPILSLWDGPWKRAGRPHFFINNPARQ